MSEQGLAVPGVGHRPPVPFSAPRARGFVPLCPHTLPQVCACWGWMCSAFEAKSALIKSGFHSTSHLPRGSSLWNLFFLCEVIFLKHATTEKQGLSSCEELSPAVCRSCFSRLPAGHQSGSLGLCSATVPFPDCLAQSTCSQDKFQPVSIWGIK